MPRAAPSICTDPGCPTLVHDGKSKCTEHRLEQQRATAKQYTAREENKESIQFYNSRTWRSLSINHRKREPLCQHCLADGITKPADVVDHIVEIRDDLTKRLHTDNLQSLCYPCHNTKTAKARKARIL